MFFSLTDEGGRERERESGEKKKQHKHFPRVDLCDSITLNILSPEQAQLPSNRCSQPLMRLAQGQRELPGLLIARLKSLYLIGPVIHKEIIQRDCLSETEIGSFDYQKQQGHRNKGAIRRPRRAPFLTQITLYTENIGYQSNRKAEL